MFHQQKKHLCLLQRLKLVISSFPNQLKESHKCLPLMRKVWQMDRMLSLHSCVFSDQLTPGATLTCTCIPICAAISLQYICVSSGLRQEHEKWRRARSSVPRIGAVHSAVNGFCACVCVCVCVYFHLFSSLLERWHDESSHRSGESVAVPHLPPPFAPLLDDTGLIAASAGPVSPSPLFED